MIIKRWGFLGLGVCLERPAPDWDSRERRAYHALWIAEFRWHHALRHWLFGGERPRPKRHMGRAFPAAPVATDREGHLLVVASCDQFRSLARILEMAQLFAQGPRARRVVRYLCGSRRQMGLGCENHQGRASQMAEMIMAKPTFGLAPRRRETPRINAHLNGFSEESRLGHPSLLVALHPQSGSFVLPPCC